MFNPIKGAGQLGQLKKLRDEAKKIQDELGRIEVEEEKGRAYIKLTADMKVKSVRVNGEEMSDLRDAINDAIEKAQKKAAHKMQEMGGGLMGLFGGGQ